MAESAMDSMGKAEEASAGEKKSRAALTCRQASKKRAQNSGSSRIWIHLSGGGTLLESRVYIEGLYEGFMV